MISEVKEVKAYIKTKKKNKKGEEKESSVPVPIGIKVCFDNINPLLVGFDKVLEDGERIAPHGTVVFFSYRHDSYTIHQPSSPEFDPNSFDTDQWGRNVRGTGKEVYIGKDGLPITHESKSGGLTFKQFSTWAWSAIALDAIIGLMEEIAEEKAAAA